MHDGKQGVDELSKLTTVDSSTSLKSMSTLSPSSNALVKTVMDHNKYTEPNDGASTLKN